MVATDRPSTEPTLDVTLDSEPTAADWAATSTPTQDIPAARLTSRSIRSFVVRNGRMTPAQQDALDRLMPQFGIRYPEQSGDASSRPAEPMDLSAVFGREAPTWLEIGFGNGDALLHMASEHPDVNLLGVEVHAPGVGHALLGIEARQLRNVRIIQHDAMEVLEHMLAPATLAKVLLFFPDPWHKKRHHKRRIVQQEFIDGVASRLMSGAMLHCATDWAEYAEWMLERLNDSAQFVNQSPDNTYCPQPSWRRSTRFERRGQRLGHEVFDLLYTRH